MRIQRRLARIALTPPCAKTAHCHAGSEHTSTLVHHKSLIVIGGVAPPTVNDSAGPVGAPKPARSWGTPQREPVM